MPQLVISNAVDVGLDELADLVLEAHAGEEALQPCFQGGIGTQRRALTRPLVWVRDAAGRIRCQRRGAARNQQEGAENHGRGYSTGSHGPNGCISHEFGAPAPDAALGMHELSAESHAIDSVVNRSPAGTGARAPRISFITRRRRGDSHPAGRPPGSATKGRLTCWSP